MSTILVTGGAGFIGSHTVLELLNAGQRVVVVDNLDNSSSEALRRVERITGKTVDFHILDLLDKPGLDLVFKRYHIDAVIHFAGLKAVGESTQQPLRYYHNNLTGTLHLLEAMGAAGCKNLVFSSSATVYGDPERIPIVEDQALRTTNPYGATKLMIEGICRDLAKADPAWHIVLLRYFNPVGAHASGQIGEDPSGIPNNLMPFLMQVAVGKRPHLNIFGKDWPTPDGTGVRDYIHVVDLALGHLAALAKAPELPGCTAINLGTGTGTSVLDMVHAASRAVGRDLPHQFAPRRPGDIGVCYSDATLAKRLLGWTATRGLDQMCSDHWRWQSQNPDGYAARG
jgi:UDP-glucose 4-epimerase